EFAAQLTEPDGGEGVDLPAAGGVETGPTSWQIFMGQLAAMEIRDIRLRLLSWEDRRRLVKMAELEEELEWRAVARNRERVARQARGEARERWDNRKEKRGRGVAALGSLAAMQELERRGKVTEEEVGRWKRVRAEKVERIRGIGAKHNAEVKMKKVREQAVGVDGEKAGETEAGKAGIERELTVVRAGPNPRLLVCRYKELAEEKVCKVRVKDSGKWMVGMRLVMREPVGEREYVEPWEYAGPEPRFKGRW